MFKLFHAILLVTLSLASPLLQAAEMRRNIETSEPKQDKSKAIQQDKKRQNLLKGFLKGEIGSPTAERVMRDRR